MKSVYTTTKFAAFAFGLLLAACTTDLYEGDKDVPVVNPDENEINIPDDFDFSTVSKPTLTVNVIDEYEGTKKYTVEGYDDNPIFNPSATLLFRRKTNGKNPCVIEDVTFPKTLKTLYIRQTDPYGLMSVYTFDLEGEGDKVFDLKPADAPVTKAQGSLRSAEFPVNFDKGDAETVTNVSQIKNNGKYYIPKGTTVTFEQGAMQEGNSRKMEKVTLYVDGTVEFKIKEMEFKDDCQIYVLADGKIVGNGVDVECKDGSDIYNQGVIEGIDDLSTEENDTNNDCVIYNEGTITVNDLTVDGTRIFNYCLIDVKEDFESEGAGSSLYLTGGAFLCSQFEISEGSSAIYFGPRAILKGKNAQFKATCNIVGAGNGASLSKNDWAVFQFDRLSLNFAGWGSAYWCVEFACNSVKGSGQFATPVWSSTRDKDGNVIPSFVIEPTPCNGYTSSDPDKKEDTDDTTSETPEETGTYTFLFEDNWPSFGDYDMNDIVLDLNVANQEIDQKGNAKSAIITAHLQAVGATKELYMFVRANNMVREEIPLFDGKEAHACLGDYNRSQMINTEKYDSDPVPYQTTVDLTGGTLSLGTLDVYIVWGNPNAADRNEIHLAGFSGTDRAKVSGTSVNYRYKSGSAEGDKFENMMWGLMIPRNFKYPKELHSIMEVYPQFVKWAQSGGTKYEDWYENAEGPVYTGKSE